MVPLTTSKHNIAIFFYQQNPSIAYVCISSLTVIKKEILFRHKVYISFRFLPLGKKARKERKQREVTAASRQLNCTFGQHWDFRQGGGRKV